MVGMIDPHPSKQPNKSAESWWKGAFTNPVQIKRPAQGKYSPKTDERCFTWCSQSARGRYEGQDPWCRSICIRRVFEHEVKQLTTHFSHDSAHHSRSQIGKESTAEYPLPPEGQPASAIVDGVVGGIDAHGRTTAEGLRYWQEGWYVWMTKNRWAAQEKMDLMMLDLDKQTSWLRTKEQEERAWAEREAQVEKEHACGSDGHEPPAVVPEDLEHDGQEGPLRHPYPSATEESFLIRVPTKIPPLDVYARQTLAPTWKVLEIVEKSIQSGDQKDLAVRAWETAWSGAPFKLVKNVFKVCADSLKKGPKDEDS